MRAQSELKFESYAIPCPHCEKQRTHPKGPRIPLERSGDGQQILIPYLGSIFLKKLLINKILLRHQVNFGLPLVFHMVIQLSIEPDNKNCEVGDQEISRIPFFEPLKCKVKPNSFRSLIQKSFIGFPTFHIVGNIFIFEFKGSVRSVVKFPQNNTTVIAFWN